MQVCGAEIYFLKRATWASEIAFFIHIQSNLFGMKLQSESNQTSTILYLCVFKNTHLLLLSLVSSIHSTYLVVYGNVQFIYYCESVHRSATTLKPAAKYCTVHLHRDIGSESFSVLSLGVETYIRMRSQNVLKTLCCRLKKDVRGLTVTRKNTSIKPCNIR